MNIVIMFKYLFLKRNKFGNIENLQAYTFTLSRIQESFLKVCVGLEKWNLLGIFSSL